MQELAGALLRVQDEERRKVARQLHEGTGQNLAGASLIASRVHNDAPEPMRRPIRDLSDILQQSVRELRTLSQGLHPPLLDELGLALALRSYVNNFSQHSGIAVDLSLPTIERLPGEVELALFRVIEEALTNIYRDSDSTSARIHLAIREEGSARELALTVEGFGTGVRSGIRVSLLSGRAVGSLEASGLGVQGMRERLRQIGGRLKIDSASGRTVMTATVPLGQCGDPLSGIPERLACCIRSRIAAAGGRRLCRCGQLVGTFPARKSWELQLHGCIGLTIIRLPVLGRDTKT